MILDGAAITSSFLITSSPIHMQSPSLIQSNEVLQLKKHSPTKSIIFLLFSSI